MNLLDLQNWLISKGANIKATGIANKETKDAILNIFKNKNATAITESELKTLANQLKDTSTKRINAVAHVESNGSGFDENGLVKILWERHYFFKFTNKKIKSETFNDDLSNPNSGGYTKDINNNKINDSWERLIDAMMIDPDSALQSVSMGKFQIMGKYYNLLGYPHPIEMLYHMTRTEFAHYKALVGYILNVAHSGTYFLQMNETPASCVNFAITYNGQNYKKYNYHIKLANYIKNN